MAYDTPGLGDPFTFFREQNDKRKADLTKERNIFQDGGESLGSGRKGAKAYKKKYGKKPLKEETGKAAYASEKSAYEKKYGKNGEKSSNSGAFPEYKKKQYKKTKKKNTHYS